MRFTLVETLISMSFESKKNAHLGAFFRPLNELDTGQGVKLTRLMSILTSKKVLKFLIKIQLTKSDPKGQGMEGALPHAN